MTRSMAPLFVPRRASDPVFFSTVEHLLGQHFAAGVFASTEVQVVAQLLRRVSAELTAQPHPLDADLALAMALAIRAPAHAHICVDLAEVELADLLLVSTSDSGPAAPALPADRDDWITRLSAIKPLVREPGEGRITPFVLDGTWLYIDRYWRYQTRIVDRVQAWRPLARDHWPESVVAGLDYLFRPPAGQVEETGALNRQRLAAALALRNRLTVITGGPGMGKTWTVRNLLALVYLEHLESGAEGLPHIALAAPTGKAAARMRESLLDGLNQEFVPILAQFLSDSEAKRVGEYISGIKASTLHRLLGGRPDSRSRFRHNRSNPLPYDTVIVDEVSMVDFRMMAKLMDAIADSSHRPIRLVLLGDRDQLASVEAGTVLADLCGSTTADGVRLSEGCVHDLPPVPSLDFERFQSLGSLIDWRPPGMDDRVVQFNQTFRFGADSGIKRFATACIADPFESSDALAALGDEGSDDTALVEYTSTGIPATIDGLIRAEFRPYLELLRYSWQEDPSRFPCVEVYHRRLLECFDRFRVLCAFRRGRTGVEGFNARVTRLLSRTEEEPLGLRPEENFFIGRPIMVTRNDYSVDRFNGDIGLVVPMADHGEEDRLMVVFPGEAGLPTEAAINARGTVLQPEEYEANSLVEYLSVGRLPEHVTVFAMTIHKSQGSQFGHVMVVLPNQQQRSPILTRELVYTGVTRASRRVTVLSSKTLLADTLSTPIKRASQLGTKLWETTD